MPLFRSAYEIKKSRKIIFSIVTEDFEQLQSAEFKRFAIHACRGASLGVTTTGVVIGRTETSFRVQIFEDKKSYQERDTVIL